jgi:hypothetical protein
LKKPSTLGPYFGVWVEAIPIFEVDVGGVMAKEYSLPYFEAPQTLFKWNVAQQSQIGPFLEV